MRPPRSGKLERAPRNSLDRLRRVLAGVVGRAVGKPAAGAVVEAADELPDDQQVDAGPGRGTEVRIDVESATEGDQALLRPHGRTLELGQADRTEDDGVGGLARRQRPSGKRHALVEDRAPAEAVLLDLELERERAEDVDRDRSHLRSDSVSGQADDAQHQRSIRAPGPTAAAAAPAAVPSWVLFLGGERLCTVIRAYRSRCRK